MTALKLAKCKACIVVVSLVAGIGSASAQAPQPSTVDIMRTWGILGTWAENCKEAQALGIGFFSWGAQADGRGDAVHARRLPAITDQHTVANASVLDDGRLRFDFLFDEGRRSLRNTWTRGPDGRIRIFANVDIKTSKHTVVDGKLVHNSRETPWLERCSEQFIS